MREGRGGAHPHLRAHRVLGHSARLGLGAREQIFFCAAHNILILIWTWSCTVTTATPRRAPALQLTRHRSRPSSGGLPRRPMLCAKC